jgi:GcrA cell cycle regulator
MNSRASHPWSADELDVVKKMWLEGSTASEIATAIGQGVSRSAVIGKVNRLKLGGHGPTTRVEKQQLSAAPRSRGNGKGGLSFKVAQARKAGLSLQEGMEIVLGTPQPYRDEPDDGVDVTHLVGLLDLTNRSCRWPVGDPSTTGFGFCGAPIADGKAINDAGQPYCRAHQRRASSG